MSSSLFRIVYFDGRAEERAFGDGKFRIGRESGDLVLSDPSSSAVHGELSISGSSITYTDLGSSNGSFDAQNQRLTAPLPLYLEAPCASGAASSPSSARLSQAQPAPNRCPS